VFAGGVCAQGASVEKLSFDVPGAVEKGAMVSGDLRIPESKQARLPAVLILHTATGFDGRGSFYADALNQAGIATVEIDYLRGKGIPPSAYDNLPHVYETLRHLARHRRIDGERIGVLGFSWGGLLAVAASSAELTRRYAGGQLRFAAHLGLYPLCWIHRSALAGKSKYFDSVLYRAVTGSPVQIVGGGKDDGDDDPAMCEKFVAQLPAPVRPHFEVKVYPEATFAWDSRFSSATHMVGAKQGKGGIVNIVASERIAAQSRELAVSFFEKALAPR
jgi:dienelactone hydrolase